MLARNHGAATAESHISRMTIGLPMRTTKDIVFMLPGETAIAPTSNTSFAATSIIPTKMVTASVWRDLRGLQGSRSVISRRLKYSSTDTHLLVNYSDNRLIHAEWIVPAYKMKHRYPFLPQDCHAIIACTTHPEFRGRGIYAEQLKVLKSTKISGNYFIWANENNQPSLRGILKAGGKEYGHLVQTQVFGFVASRLFVPAS